MLMQLYLPFVHIFKEISLRSALCKNKIANLLL